MPPPPRRSPGARPERGVRAERGGRSEQVRRSDRGVRAERARADAVRGGRPAQAGRPVAGNSRQAGRAGTANSRPAGVRRQATGVAAKRTRAPQPRRYTGLAAVLGMVLIGLLLAYAYPVRVYLAQQAEIAGLEQKQDEQRRRIAVLAEERAKWDDPEYIKAQAKKELHYVPPGVIPFITLPDPAQTNGAAGTAGDSRKAAADPWHAKLWSSVDAANRQDRP